MLSAQTSRYFKIGTIAAGFVLLAIVSFAVVTVMSFRSTSDAVLHTQEVRLRLGELHARFQDAQLATRAFVMNMDARALPARATAQSEFERVEGVLRTLARDNARQQAALDALAKANREVAAEHDALIALRRSGGFQAAAAKASDGRWKRLADEMKTIIDEMETEEKQLLEQRLAGARQKGATTIAVLIAGLLLDVVLAGALVLMLRRDLVKRKRFEEVLQSGRAYAESIVDTVREPLVILTDDLKVNSANRMFYETFGVTPADVVGARFAELQGGVWNIPELQSELATIIPQHSEFNDFEVSATFPTIGSKTMRLNARKLYRVGNNTTNILVAIEDITRRKKAEVALQHEKYLLRELMDNVVESIYFKDRSSRFTRVNLGLARRFNLTSSDEAVGKSDVDFFSDEHARRAREDEELVMRSGQPVTKEEKESWPDGRETWALTVKLPLRNDVGEIVGTFGLSRDITARKLAEAQLQTLNTSLNRRSHELEAANQELEAFSYSVSHDLRAPLRHIDYFASMLRKNLPPERLDAKNGRYLSTISESARGMGQLIDDLLTFARIGRAELRRSPVSLDELISEAQGSLQSEINGREIEWRRGPLPHVEGDSALLRQVVMNLLGNAVKYTRHRTQATIEIGTQPAPAGEVVVFVRDNGAGFDMKYVEKLFGVFQRLHSNDQFEGTGVGLANVRRIVQRHGGRTWAEGVVEGGATFYFSLPSVHSTAA